MREGWEYKKLGDCTEILDSQRKPVTKKDRKGGEYPYYGATGIQDYVDKYIFDGRYVLVGEDGAKWSAFDNSAYIIEGKSWVNNHAHVLKPYDYLKDTFLAYFLNYSDLDSYISGAIVRKLTQASLRNIDIPLPPLSTQLAIVSELDKINELIRLKKEQLKDYDNLAQSIFYEMFGDPVENEKGWEVKKLGEFGKVVTGNTPSRKVESYYSENFIEWIKTDNIYDELIFPTPAAEYLSKEGSLVGRKVRKDSVLVACIAGSMSSIGKCCITNREVAFNQQINGIEPYKDIVESKFLYCLINFSKKYIQESATNGMKHILSKSNFEDIQFPLPPLPLQQLFASRITQIEAQKAEVQRAITDLETLLASRMQYWFE